MKLPQKKEGRAVYEHAYTVREGERTAGFRYGVVNERAGKKPGFDEKSVSFHLDVKLEYGNKSESIELTPKAPMNTELWAAPELQAAATNKTSYVYAEPGIEEGEASLMCILLTPDGEDLLLEEVRMHDTFSEEPDTPERDEIHLGNVGRVVKEVTDNSVIELLFTTGAVPASKKGEST